MSNNGHGPKRKRIEETFTFESTGVSVTYTRVPLQLVIDFESGWKRKHPAPRVPQSEENIGGTIKVIENPSDPDYQDAKAAWEVEKNHATYRFMLKKAIVLNDENMIEVKSLISEAEEAGSELDSDPAWVFLFNIASPDPNEIADFQAAILRLSQPTEQGVSDAKERFPDKV